MKLGPGGGDERAAIAAYYAERFADTPYSDLRTVERQHARAASVCHPGAAALMTHLSSRVTAVCHLTSLRLLS